MSRPRLTAFLLLSLGLALGLVAAGASSPHDPIRIRSEADLRPGNGVVSGSGNAEDPYIISGWAIEVRAGIGIEVRGISCHLVVEDCDLTGSPRGTTGILLEAAPHARIASCTFLGLDTGVFLYRGDKASVEESVFTGCRRAIEGSESDAILVAGNRMEDGTEDGVFLWRCDDVRLVDNVVSRCVDGLYLDSCHRGALFGNHVAGGDHGIFLWDCFDCTVTGNTVRDCELGLAVVHTSEGNRLSANTVFDTARPATCDRAGNAWDDGYPAGGNFWAGEAFEDRFSGADQDEPGADGIADAPRAIPFESIDRYPLMAAPDGVEEGPEPIHENREDAQ